LRKKSVATALACSFQNAELGQVGENSVIAWDWAADSTVVGASEIGSVYGGIISEFLKCCSGV
jgi:hypothetical protein